MAPGIVAGTARGRAAGIGQRAIRAAKDRLNLLWCSRRVNFDRVNFDPNSGRLANPPGAPRVLVGRLVRHHGDHRKHVKSKIPTGSVES